MSTLDGQEDWQTQSSNCIDAADALLHGKSVSSFESRYGYAILRALRDPTTGAFILHLMMTLIIKIDLFNTLPQKFFQKPLKLPQITINLAAKDLARSGSYDANLTGKY